MTKANKQSAYNHLERRWKQLLASGRGYMGLDIAEPIKPGVNISKLPARAVRRNAARKAGIIRYWRLGRRFKTQQGNHIVVYPTSEDLR